MRRWITALACAAALLPSTGCTAPAPPAGLDGDLTDGWSAIDAPAPFRPAAGTCHEELTTAVPMDAYQPVECRELHVSETVFVGTLTGTAAAAGEAPAVGSAASRTAYRQCSKRASTFAGAPWRTGLLTLTVGWPAPEAWSGGARWYRCELTQADLTSARQISREGSLRESLAGPAPLRLRCFDPAVAGGRVDSMRPVPCTKRHRAEFVGIFKAPDMDFTELTADRERTAKGCRSAIARYAGVPDDSNVQFRSGWISYNPTEDEWRQGERGVRCFTWFNDEQVTRSVKGVGPRGLPIRYS
jgi:hypothetical protein